MSEYEHIHPRMVYEILNRIRENGSIDSYQIKDILDMFPDLNNEEACQPQAEKNEVYLRRGIEAIQESMSRHQNNSY
jgi:hypothetical protein